MRRPSPALVVACIALLVSLGGTSYATVLNVPKNSVGTPQLKRNAVKPAKLAPNAVRTAHVLNGSLLAADFQAGQIPRGPKGDKGDKGDPGPTGAVGVSGLQVVSAMSANDSNTSKSVTALCPAGKRAIAGGAATTSPLGAVALTSSNPHVAGDRWVASAVEVNATGFNWFVNAYVVCANVS